MNKFGSEKTYFKLNHEQQEHRKLYHFNMPNNVVSLVKADSHAYHNLVFSDIQREPKACQSRPACENALRVSIVNTEIFGSIRSKEISLS